MGLGVLGRRWELLSEGSGGNFITGVMSGQIRMVSIVRGWLGNIGCDVILLPLYNSLGMGLGAYGLGMRLGTYQT